jgi:RimJ/RimL family protein N-acetyltransferase
MVIRLEIERLILRAPRLSDVDNFLEGLNNKNLLKNITPFLYPIKKDDFLDVIKDTIKEWKSKYKSNYIFAIELKSKKKVIGEVSLSCVRKKHGTAEIGSWLNQKY